MSIIANFKYEALYRPLVTIIDEVQGFYIINILYYPLTAQRNRSSLLYGQSKFGAASGQPDMYF